MTDSFIWPCHICYTSYGYDTLTTSSCLHSICDELRKHSQVFTILYEEKMMMIMIKAQVLPSFLHRFFFFLQMGKVSFFSTRGTFLLPEAILDTLISHLASFHSLWHMKLRFLQFPAFRNLSFRFTVNDKWRKRERIFKGAENRETHSRDPK